MHSIILYGGTLFLFCILSIYMTKWIFLWLKQNNKISLNYEGNKIIQSFGISIFILYFFFLFIQYLLELSFHLIPSYAEYRFQFMIFVFVLSLMGWMDDHHGKDKVKGIRGHIMALVRERCITTGLGKAIIGSFISFYVSISLANHVAEVFFYWAILVTSIHFFNLLDVRPGRTIKGFWLLSFFILIFLNIHFVYQFYLPLMITTIFIFQYDRKSLAMLGDTGSNTLGGIFGFYILFIPLVELQLLFLLLFIMSGIIAEKYSFSELINKSNLLSKWDNWGIK